MSLEKISKLVSADGCFSYEETISYLQRIGYCSERPDIVEIRICLWAERMINSY